MTDVSPPGGAMRRWGGGTPVEWAVLVILVTAMAMLFWYELPVLASIVNGMVLAIAPAMALWRQYARVEPQRRRGPHLAILACSFVIIAIGLAPLILS